MKRWIAVAAVLAVLLTATVAVLADPINVGGNFTASASKACGPAIYRGEGNPQGVPFQTLETTALCSPINVGGN